MRTINIDDINFDIIEDKFPTLENHIKEYDNHCVTYLIHNSEQIYIGETANFRKRVLDHSKSSKKEKNLIETKIIISEYFNKSAVRDIETKLINYIDADEKFKVINNNFNQADHEYFLKKEINHELFRKIWNQLKSKKLVNKTLEEIENSPIFKLSPHKDFSNEQRDIIEKIIDKITTKTDEEILCFDGSIEKNRVFNKKEEKIIVSGEPGTGKSLIIIKIIHLLQKRYQLEDAKFGICIPQSSLRITFHLLIKKNKLNVKLLKPVDLSKNLDDQYDLIIIDEAHRLKKHFSKQSKDLKHLENGKYTEIDFALQKSKHLILMYDQKQTVRPADINHNEIEKIKGTHFSLTKQFRIKNSAKYTLFIESLLQISNQVPNAKDIGDYDFKIFENLKDLMTNIQDKEKNHELCRMGSGYYIEWLSSKNPQIYDFESEGLKVKWNTTVEGWVQSKNAVNEIGCIHTLQGQDLNYAGIIIGDDIYYDNQTKQIKINKDNYYDQNGTPVKNSPTFDKDLEKYIKQIYYVLLTRGMLGTYVYIKDQNLRDYVSSLLIKKHSSV